MSISDCTSLSTYEATHPRCSVEEFMPHEKTRGIRTTRLNREPGPWHGLAGSYHLDSARYPGGNPSGPASFYNNYEGGFHTTAFWVLSDRGRTKPGPFIA